MYLAYFRAPPRSNGTVSKTRTLPIKWQWITSDSFMYAVERGELTPMYWSVHLPRTNPRKYPAYPYLVSETIWFNHKVGVSRDSTSCVLLEQPHSFIQHPIVIRYWNSTRMLEHAKKIDLIRLTFTALPKVIQLCKSTFCRNEVFLTAQFCKMVLILFWHKLAM